MNLDSVSPKEVAAKVRRITGPPVVVYATESAIKYRISARSRNPRISSLSGKVRKITAGIRASQVYTSIQNLPAHTYIHTSCVGDARTRYAIPRGARELAGVGEVVGGRAFEGSER